jgi:hypothetical protein
MLLPVKLKLATFEAEALRQYMLRMFEISLNKEARNEVILLGEYYPKIESTVRSKLFRHTRKVSCYTIPLSIARTLWCRWQKEQVSEPIQMILVKIDYELETMNRKPQFPTKLL